jgi:hypothetical protein
MANIKYTKWRKDHRNCIVCDVEYRVRNYPTDFSKYCCSKECAEKLKDIIKNHPKIMGLDKLRSDIDHDLV